jgi:hypothetical protein
LAPESEFVIQRSMTMGDGGRDARAYLPEGQREQDDDGHEYEYSRLALHLAQNLHLERRCGRGAVDTDWCRVDSSTLNGSEGNGPSVKLTSRRADGDDDGLEAESQDRRSECRRCREHGYIERRVDQEGHEAEESPEALRAVRARGEVPLKVQGVRCLSARPSALSVQGVRWGINLRARSCALHMQGVRWGVNLRARSCALCVQGVRWCRNLRARSSAL